MKTRQSIKKMLGIVSVALVVSLGSVFAFAAKPPAQELGFDNPRVREVIAVHNLVKSEVMAMEDVLGTAVGQDDNGALSIVVYVNQQGKNPAKSVRNIPGNLRGENVTVELTGPFHALATASVTHTAKQTPPIKLGTSGGWSYDLANGYCCSGTLGSLIKIGSTQYILSNYHVFEADIVPGENGQVSQTGDPVIQPGLVDVHCNAGDAQTVATLVKLGSLSGSNIDASIAQIMPGMVSPDGAILEIGTISTSTTPARLKQAVKKSGRTTGLSRSTIKGLNATVSVVYDNECAGSTAFTKTFTNQIIVNNRARAFLAGGDSGSLMVEDVATNPRAVGLLFAGSNTLAVANPIDEVLQVIGGKQGGTASMVGK